MVKCQKRVYGENHIYFNTLHILFTTVHLSPTLALISNRVLLAPVFVCMREGGVKGEEFCRHRKGGVGMRRCDPMAPVAGTV